jgi:hypothetical protein
VKRSSTRFFDLLLLGETDSAWAAWKNWRADLRALPGLRLDGEFGIEYCAAGLAAHDWLGAFLETRRTLTPEAGLLPADRLQRETAARALGPFLMTWLRASDLTAAERLAFEQAHRHSVATVASQPPREEPGCAECPKRCQMLSFAAPLVSGSTRHIAPLVMQDPPEKALLAIERALVTPMQSIPAIADRPADSSVRQAWMYCLLANMKMPAAEGAVARDRLLIGLSARARAGEAKDLDVFGSA